MADRPLFEPSDWDIAGGELDELLHAHGIAASPEGKADIVKWHLQRVALARANVWIPGMAGTHDAVVEKALGRFHDLRVRMTISELITENSRLTRQLAAATESLEGYAAGRVDGGAGAKAALHRLREASGRGKMTAGERRRERALWRTSAWRKRG